jgi:hypothetical protein
MRRELLLLPLVLACAKTETAQTDSAALSSSSYAPLTAAGIAGTWEGVNMAEGSDSVTSRWTVTGDGSGQAKFVNAGSTDTVVFTSTFDADSMMSTSPAYEDPAFPVGSIMFRSVGRLRDGKLVGNSTIVLADKPDSVVARGRWEATRVP